MLNIFSLQLSPTWGKKPTKGTLTCVLSCFSLLPFPCHLAQSLERVKGSQIGGGQRAWRRGGKVNSTTQSLPCGILAKKRDTTHFWDEDQAAASVYSTASAVFSSLDATAETVSQTPAVNIAAKCTPHKSTSECKCPGFLLSRQSHMGVPVGVHHIQLVCD